MYSITEETKFSGLCSFLGVFRIEKAVKRKNLSRKISIGL